MIDTICCQEALEKFRTQSSTLLSFVKANKTSDMSVKATELDCAEDFIGRSLISKYHEYLGWCSDYGKSRQSLKPLPIIYAPNLICRFGKVNL